MDAQQSNAWRVQFVLLAAIWGSSFLFIKILDRHWPPTWVAFGRVSLGAVTLLVLLVARRERLRFERRVWLHLVVAAMLFNVVPFTLFAYGERHISSVFAGLWNATTPLWLTVIVLLAFDEEHPSRERIGGLVVGFTGVVLLLGPWRGLGHGQVTGNLACAGAALCYGAGFPYTRRYLASLSHSGVALSTGQLVCATGLLALTIPFARSPSSHIGLEGAGSILALGALGSGVAYALNYSVVRAVGSIVAGAVTYLIPVFSTLLGVVVLGETLTWNQPLGALVLLSGIAVAEGRLRAPTRTSTPPAPAPPSVAPRSAPRPLCR